MHVRERRKEVREKVRQRHRDIAYTPKGVGGRSEGGGWGRANRREEKRAGEREEASKRASERASERGRGRER